MGKRRRRTKHQSMNVDGVVFQATALRQVANDLQQSINQVKEPTVPGDVNWGRWIMGYVSSTLILRALATELLLKALSYRRCGTYRIDRDGHDLLVLFGDLDGDTNQLIDEIANTHGIRPLEKILEKHRGDFVNFRYFLMEDGQTHVDLQDLDKAFFVLTEVLQSQKFSQLCASGADTGLS